MSNFHSDLSLKLSQGEVRDFSGEVQKLSGEVQNDLRGGAHLPSKSGHGLHDFHIQLYTLLANQKARLTTMYNNNRYDIFLANVFPRK
jgi:hypothetical protein